MPNLVPVSVSTDAVVVDHATSACLLSTKIDSTSLEVVEVPLFSCCLDDIQNVALTGKAKLLESFTPVSIYGSAGIASLYAYHSLDVNVRAPWRQCPNVAYCFGPELESVPVLSELDRFEDRWKFLYLDGFFTYGKVGEELQPAPVSLFPAYYACETFSTCFDQNGRPVYACVLANQIEIRRLSADNLVTISFTGTTPILFQNALLQPDSSYHDVVCYYLRASFLCARYQRDNFEVEYVLTTALGITALHYVRSAKERNDPFEYILARQECALRYFKSLPYPAWPILVLDSGAAVYGVDSVEYDSLIAELGTYLEPATTIYGIDSISYQSTTVELSGGVEEGIMAGYSVDSLDYFLVVMEIGTYVEAGTLSAYAVESLSYPFVSVNAGIYTEAGTTLAYGINSITYE